jgi:hypothetical protein
LTLAFTTLRRRHYGKAEILATCGAVDVAAAIQAVADASPAANLVRNAAHAAAQRLPGEISAAPQILQLCCDPQPAGAEVRRTGCPFGAICSEQCGA